MVVPWTKVWPWRWKEIKAFKSHLGSKIYGHGDAFCVEQGERIGLLDFVQ